MGRRALSTEDRHFLAMLADVVFGNPFAELPDAFRSFAADTTSTGSGHRHDHYLPALVPAVEACLERVDRGRPCVAGELDGEDRQLFEYAVLFLTYSVHVEAMDEHIERQVQAGAEPAAAPFAAEALASLVARGFEAPEAMRYLALFYQLRRGFYFIDHSLVGQSESMRELRRALWNSAFTRDVRVYARRLWGRMEDFSTLLLGETGTGKGAAAAALGRSGFIPYDERRGRFAHSFMTSFLAINLSQYAESLIESELFGHRRGAFTGAVDDHQGVFERCTPHGTLFLDEIGDVSVPVQIKLLGVLQERVFARVGSHEQRRFQGRVVAATNRSLDALRASGEFRDDFYYRLSSDVVTVPTLRQRIEEDPDELARLVHLLIGRVVGTADDALGTLCRDALARDLPAGYAWPGNVRELEQAVRRILLTGHYRGDSAGGRTASAEESLIAGIHAGAYEAREILARYCALLYQRLGTYEAVAQRAGLDRRTAKKHVDAGRSMARIRSAD
jgi:DNA-binding NtrC family response regulator